MAISVCDVSITELPLDLPASENDPAVGAVVDFVGVVRALENGTEIAGIEYEAHSTMAEHQLRIIAQTATDRFRVTRILIRHRVGFVAIGQASIVVRVESSHRSAAFTASQWIMEELKRIVPIWKQPVVRGASNPEAVPDNPLAPPRASSSALA